MLIAQQVVIIECRPNDSGRRHGQMSLGVASGCGQQDDQQ